MVKEQERLDIGYASYAVHKKPIPVPSRALVTLDPQSDDSSKIHISLIDAQGPYMIFEVGPIWIAVILDDKNGLFNTTLSTQELDRITAYAGPNRQFKNIAEVVLQPVSADRNAPLEIEGIEAWLMLAEITAVRIKDEKSGALIWERQIEEKEETVEEDYNLMQW